MEEVTNQNRPEEARPPPKGEPAAEHSFDELAKGLANRNLSRHDALKWVGAAFVGGLLASVPGVAWAKKRPPPQSPPPPPPPPASPPPPPPASPPSPPVCCPRGGCFPEGWLCCPEGPDIACHPAYNCTSEGCVQWAWYG
jgi:hypothetical protein